MLRYRLPWQPCGASFSAMAGYRIFAFEWSHIDNPVNTGFPVPRHGSVNLEFRGPFLGLATRF